MKKWTVPILVFLMLTGCTASEAEPSSNEDTTDVESSLAEIAANLEIPWSINKTGDEFYISERPGTIAHIDENGQLTRQKVEFSDALSDAAEAGFLGFVL